MSTKKRATPAGSCSPIVVLLISESYKTARSILRDFSQFKKAGNARRRLLAYRSFVYIKIMQNGEVDLAQIFTVQKNAQPPK